MKKITFSQEPIGDTIKLQGKLHIVYGKETVTRVEHDGEERLEYTAYVDLAVADNTEYITHRVAKLEAALAKAKAAETLGKLTVATSNGNVFDANLEARVNMADGILAADTLGTTESIWKLADNSEVIVDVSELREAHVLALQAYASTKRIGK